MGWELSPNLPQHKKNRFVRAALLNGTNELVAIAENQNSRNKSHHAEVVLLQSYFRDLQKGFPEPMTLYTSLQCCKMCAAMFWHMHSNPWKNLKSIYLEPETGPSARDSILAANGNIRRSLAPTPELGSQPSEFFEAPIYF
jgi:hypothetical protein